MLTDVPGLFSKALAGIHENNKELLRRQVKSPGMAFISYENTGSTTMSPSVYTEFCEPYLNDYSDIIHREGKLHLIHACGKFKLFSNLIKRGSFDGVVDIAPSPTGDIELWEAKEGFGNKVVTRGIDCTTFAMATPQEANQKSLRIIVGELLWMSIQENICRVKIDTPL